MANQSHAGTIWANTIIPKFVTVLSIVFGIYAILYLAGILSRVNLEPVTYQHNAIFVAVSTLLAFILFPAKKGQVRPYGVAWYDVVLIIFSVVPLLYLAIGYDLVMAHTAIGLSTDYEAVLALLLFISLLEAVRRTVGLGFTIIVFFFLVYPLVGSYMPGVLKCPNFDYDRVVYQIYLTADGVLGMPVDVIASMVIAFIFFGSVLQNTGGGAAILNFTFSLVGHLRGGPAKAAVVASGLFGSISGSTVANVTTTGTFTIPMMKKIGFSPEFAGAVEAVASNGGQLLPPVMGAMAFLMSQITGIPYITICYHAFLSAILYYLIEFVIVDREAARLRLRSMSKDERPPLKKSLKEVYIYVIPVLTLVYLLAVLRYSVGKSGLYASGLVVLVSLFKKETRLTLSGLVEVFRDSAQSLVMVTMACAGAGILVGSLSLTALGSNFSLMLVDLSGGSLFFLLFYTAIACFIFGMIGSGIASYLALSPLIVPALVKGGVPVVAGHLFLIWWACTAYITPPVALGVFAANAIAGGSMMRMGWWAVRLGAGTFIIPFMFVYNPALVMLGSAGEITIQTITAFIGMGAISLSIIGYVFHNLHWLQRVLLFAGGLFLSYYTVLSNTVGLAFVIFALLWEVLVLKSYRSKVLI